MTSAFLRSTSLVLTIVAYASACGAGTIHKGERKQQKIAPITRIKRKSAVQPAKVLAVDRRQMTREVIQ
jgi:hypothetical protein